MTEISRIILVPIDLHGINRATLETLVRIARQLDRALLGLLLEDIRLQRVADLPFTTEITLSGARERSLLRDHLSQRHSAVTADTQRLLDILAKQDSVELSFEDAVGARWHSALEREGPLDIFFPARIRWHRVHPPAGRRPAVIRRLGVGLPRNRDHSSALDCAAVLMQAGLVGDVYVLCHRPPAPEELRALYHSGHQVRLQTNFSGDPAAILSLIRHSPYDLVIMSRESLDNIPPTSLDNALDESGGQVLVVN